MAEKQWGSENKGIFSKEALDKLRSPEQLDTVLPITSPIGWMGLAAVAVMMVAVVIWSIFGSFTVKATAEDGKLLLKAEKRVLHKRESVDKWPQLLALYDHSYNYLSQQIILKR